MSARRAVDLVRVIAVAGAAAAGILAVAIPVAIARALAAVVRRAGGRNE